MRLGIDASNLRGGGGVTHLVELLRAAEPQNHGFSQVVVWGGTATLKRIEDRRWLVKSRQPLLDKSLPYRVYWKRFGLSSLARSTRCDSLFVPGGVYAGDFAPVVAMCRNMLPFEWPELRRYGWSLMGIRLAFLRWAQSRTFRKAEGLIFLTRYARDTVMQVVESVAGRATIIPHGVEPRFFRPPREQLAIDRYSADRPFRLLYVSIVDVYKHQWHVAEAVALLRRSGLPVALELVGPAYPPALARLNRTLDRTGPAGRCVRYEGEMPNEQLPARYAQADLCLFASSCENMPNILLEGMASGLPIACSNRGPMPEILGGAGAYFDPEDSAEIARVIRELVDSPALRTKLAKASSERARNYSWQICARETFAFLAEITRANGRKSPMAAAQS